MPQSELVASRQRSGAHPGLTRLTFKIRRNRVLEDAFEQLSTLSEDDLRGPVCCLQLITYLMRQWNVNAVVE